MKTKQMVGILVTGAVIIAVGVTGVVSNIVKSKFTQSKKSDVSSVVNNLMGETSVSLPTEDFIGVINIEGEIGPTETNAWKASTGYNHDLYMKYIDKMIKSSSNKGIMLYVNSPGGTVYESDELYLKLEEYKEKTKRPIWAYFAQEACSGGYYISMAADTIYANRNCWTGSIGVIVSLTNYKGLYDKLGIKEIDITSGPNKAMGSGGLDMTNEQKQIMQGLVDEAYDQFVSIVSEGRGINDADVRKIADGRIYTAKQAKENGLVDEVGSYEEEKQDFIQTNDFDKNITFYEPDNDMNSLVSSLFQEAEDVTPKSDAQIVKDMIDTKGKGVLKYYAE